MCNASHFRIIAGKNSHQRGGSQNTGSRQNPLPRRTFLFFDERLNQLLRSGEIVALERALGQTVAGPFEVYGKRLTLRSRQRRDEIVRILFKGDLDPLVHQEVIVRRRKQ